MPDNAESGAVPSQDARVEHTAEYHVWTCSEGHETVHNIQAICLDLDPRCPYPMSEDAADGEVCFAPLVRQLRQWQPPESDGSTLAEKE